ncbi:MAG: rRNA (guanosine2251-2-O)-methyltransferase [Clostridiales bacterium]|nr:rRNA (guanosine2251-2-O)-methyltransferase [Clostridiales bacterium]
MSEDMIIGRNPIKEALEAGREMNKLLILQDSKDRHLQKIIDMAKAKKLPIQFVDRKKLDKVADGGVHQGVIAYIAAYAYVEKEAILEAAAAKGEPPLIIICDEINDPHNLGSILRTANAVGAHGVIIPKRRSVALSQTVAKTSCGAIEYVPVCRVSNIAQTIDWLKAEGVWIAGTDMTGDLYYKANLKGSLAIVIGNEGVGISRLVKEKCDFVIRIPMMGEVSSLNASVATGVILYEVLKQRHDV